MSDCVPCPPDWPADQRWPHGRKCWFIGCDHEADVHSGFCERPDCGAEVKHREVWAQWNAEQIANEQAQEESLRFVVAQVKAARRSRALAQQCRRRRERVIKQSNDYIEAWYAIMERGRA